MLYVPLGLWVFPGHLLLPSYGRQCAERDGGIQTGLSDVLVVLVELRQNNLTVSYFRLL